MFKNRLPIVLMYICAVACRTTSLHNQTDKQVHKKNTPKYKVGDCLMVVDLPNGETESRHRIRIEKITDTKYYYRWHLETKWDSGLSSAVGDFEILERITKKVNDCPK